MPQWIGVKPLSQTCLNLITNKMASMCDKTSSTAITSNTTNQSYFDQLPSKFLEEMISTLQTKGCLKQFLCLLAAPQLGTLYLEVLSKEEYSVHFVNSLRCVYLRNLHLRSSVHINDIFLTSIIPTFAKLQVLVISNSSAGDKSLKVIGTCCRYLRELEIIDCKKITDFGVGMLCVNSARNLGREGDELGLHKSLLKLSSSGTKITNTGIRLGLETFHSLIVWDMVTGNFLAEIHEEDFLNPSSEI
ncbi:uncharacterized protein LOC124313322 [Daphnia pulicaria]|uniref:uncharacterized protein LOC124313322 n=1 Tax=Daphnia pulicaria TaxID=35523 RepID=UPI001EEAD323|nr:uncharacterized protein LOC124313322 [Daphnia pulicaria]XP_046634149.1 uncharacterized protein LOC124313322 [Daphnia pulicaria]